MRSFLLLLFFFCSYLLAEDFIEDLKIAKRIDDEQQAELSLLTNYYLQGGYFVTPSARAQDAGVAALGFSFLPPYRVFSAAFQPYDRFELSGNYFIFHNLKDENFKEGKYGDTADRILNAKIILLKEGEGGAFVPSLAVGFNDFIGSRHFQAHYICLSKTFLGLNLEATLGYGLKRLKGFFGGLAWSPFYNVFEPLKGLTFALEYDANNYKHNCHEHPQGKKVACRINGGIHLDLFDVLHLSVSSLRGEKVAFSSSIYYNFGESKGLIPKTSDPPLYTAPLNFQPIGDLREKEELSQELAFAFKGQGLELTRAFLIFEGGINELYLQIINGTYLKESDLRERITSILMTLVPENVEQIRVQIEADGLLINSYVFRSEDLKRFRKEEISSVELEVLSPMKEVVPIPSYYSASPLYQKSRHLAIWTLKPRLIPYFGSVSGKFKYNFGLLGGVEGYLFEDLLYLLQGSITLLATTQHIGDHDKLNPSRLLNVRSDGTQYRRGGSFHLERFYLQKSMNLYNGWFTRVAMGYFEIAYAGIASEILYYPISSLFAVGLEGGVFLKREYNGIGFQSKVREFEGCRAKYKSFIGYQFFCDLYLNIPKIDTDLEIRIGQFLARDKGARFELFRYFKSGLRVSFWYTLTDGKDRVNGKRFFDKGFSIVIPLDLFMTKSSRSLAGFSTSAWLRDVGAISETGKRLYNTLRFERVP